MTNPWTRKNPLMSMLLSGANAGAGAALGLWTTQVRRQQAAARKKAARQAADFWGAALTGAPRKKPRKRR